MPLIESKRRSSRAPSFLLFALLAGYAFAAEAPVEEHCDIGAPNIRDFAAASAEDCSKACLAEEACAAFTHISGWNRCFLKKAAKPKTTVKMYSGSIAVQEGTRRVSEEGEALDHNGKDWQKHTVDTPDACRELCLKASECQAFTLIGGYRTCWLKKTAGKLRPKTFRCGIKS